MTDDSKARILTEARESLRLSIEDPAEYKRQCLAKMRELEPEKTDEELERDWLIAQALFD